MLKQSVTINLAEIKELKAWLEYEPNCFKERCINGKYSEIEYLEDKLVLGYIRLIIFYIKTLIKDKLDFDCTDFVIAKLTPEQVLKFNRFKAMIPSLDIEKYAKLKLTNEELDLCHNILRFTNQDNVADMNKIVLELPNLFARRYAQHLLMANYSAYFEKDKQFVKKNS